MNVFKATPAPPLLPEVDLSKSILWSRARRGRSNILVACFPKSGSTFITKSIAAFEGFQEASYVKGYDRREAELDREAMLNMMCLHPSEHLVAQHHVRYSRPTGQLIVACQLRTIVLTRNLRDCLISAVDHCHRETVVGPTAYMDQPLYERIKSKASDVSLLQFAARLAAPWYLNFFLSWKRDAAELPEPFRPIFVDYNQFFADKTASLRALMKELGFLATSEEIERALGNEGNNLRFNKGVPGRGAQAFAEDPEASRSLQEILDCYPGVDFSEIL